MPVAELDVLGQVRMQVVAAKHEKSIEALASQSRRRASLRDARTSGCTDRVRDRRAFSQFVQS